jgi:hypothetical protein
MPNDSWFVTKCMHLSGIYLDGKINIIWSQWNMAQNTCSSFKLWVQSVDDSPKLCATVA